MKVFPTKKSFVFNLEEIKTNSSDQPSEPIKKITLWLFCDEFKDGSFVPRKDSYNKAIMYIDKLKGEHDCK